MPPQDITVGILVLSIGTIFIVLAALLLMRTFRERFCCCVRRKTTQGDGEEGSEIELQDWQLQG
jgi:hypothetical protein